MENMKLELKHLAPYLPYELYLQQEHVEGPRAHLMTGISVKYNRVDIEDGNYGWSYILGIKPILHPLSDITKEIEHNGERFVPIKMFARSAQRNIEKIVFEIKDLEILDHYVFQYLLEWHFDVFGLIEKGLAVNKNTLEK